MPLRPAAAVPAAPRRGIARPFTAARPNWAAAAAAARPGPAAPLRPAAAVPAGGRAPRPGAAGPRTSEQQRAAEPPGHGGLAGGAAAAALTAQHVLRRARQEVGQYSPSTTEGMLRWALSLRDFDPAPHARRAMFTLMLARLEVLVWCCGHVWRRSGGVGRNYGGHCTGDCTESRQRRAFLLERRHSPAVAEALASGAAAGGDAAAVRAAAVATLQAQQAALAARYEQLKLAYELRLLEVYVECCGRVYWLGLGDFADHGQGGCTEAQQRLASLIECSPAVAEALASGAAAGGDAAAVRAAAVATLQAQQAALAARYEQQLELCTAGETRRSERIAHPATMQALQSTRSTSVVGARGAGARPSLRAVTKAPLHVVSASKSHKGRWSAMDAGNDTSDDQQDIARGRGMVDELFQGWGGVGGTQNAVLSSTEYMSQAAKTFNNIEDGFYISPAFLDKITIHIAKNFMDLPKIKVPLILGIWGGKGQGKTFQCALAFKKLGISPIVMSAGELESGNAGEPAKLIRTRYREASDIIKKGKMCSLFINDLDAGAGRMGEATQYTVNNQMVNATLMNIADNPTNVQLPGVYKNEEIPRVPVICTGNDFSTLYAPLIRDGRMEKYYWNPTREDRIGVCMGIFQEDQVSRGDVEVLVDTFPGQSIDFFGALRARVYDDKVREFITGIGFENIGKRLINSKAGKVDFEKPNMPLEILIRYGKQLVEEQDNVKRVQLADAYLAGAELAGTDGSSMPETYNRQ
ncbi:Ribulose bisphosphate carboxylase/oxygenase activase [Scenedesmus sp. PABB004]|nr:Ribulose bisphosphate carboxylase/oxygenase activase [Scenedesmus sp. PABB004]